MRERSGLVIRQERDVCSRARVQDPTGSRRSFLAKVERGLACSI